jgi:hypothetical protein
MKTMRSCTSQPSWEEHAQELCNVEVENPLVVIVDTVLDGEAQGILSRLDLWVGESIKQPRIGLDPECLLDMMTRPTRENNA